MHVNPSRNWLEAGKVTWEVLITVHKLTLGFSAASCVYNMQCSIKFRVKPLDTNMAHFPTPSSLRDFPIDIIDCELYDFGRRDH